MKRIEGFIDLAYLLKNAGIDVDKIENLDTFKIGDVTYYFKASEYTNPYSELLGEELIKDFHLTPAKYDLAIFKGKKGVISENTHEDGVKYISGSTLISEYQESTEAERYSNRVWSNSLETLWNVLDYRYRDNPKKKDIVFDLMDKIVQMYIFDIITSQFDRHSSNYEILEDGNYINLAPIYDNEGIVHRIHDESLGLLVDEDNNNDLFYQLDKFIRTGDSSYLDRLKENMWVISDNNLINKFHLIEQKTEYPMDEETKKMYLERFRIHRERLEEVLNNYNTRKVIK